jgi:hypothetical protein
LTWMPLLLADSSPCLRFLVHKELLHNEEEASELESLREADPLVRSLVNLQGEDGSWGSGTLQGNAPQGDIQITAQVLTRLGYLGYGKDYEPVRMGSEYLFSQQLSDGSWPLGGYVADGEKTETYDVMSLQTSLPLRGLASVGYAEDFRAERAYGWLIEQRLADGAWPTGVARDVYGYVEALSLHPRRRGGSEAVRALDLLLGRETRERRHLGYDVARLIGAEPSTGFITYYARFDMAQILGICGRLGATVDDNRISDLVDHIRGLQGDYGLWEYLPKPQVSRWLTLDILRSLVKVDVEGDWVNMEPRTPFRAYPKKVKRF